MTTHTIQVEQQPWDKVIQDIADYVINYNINSTQAYQTAHYTVFDAIGCGYLALKFGECTKLMGPVVPGTAVPNGCRVPGTNFVLDPVSASFNIGCMNRWLDFNDTWLGKEWGHPSDNLATVLSVAQYVVNHQHKSVTMRDVLTALIKCYEIQGVLALENSFNQVGLDHVVLVKVASVAVATHMLGGNRLEIMNAISNAWIDGQALRTYRHHPNTGSRKCWAAGDASSRAVRLALMAVNGEQGYPSALTAKIWGFYDVYFGGKEFRFQRPYGSYVMENVLFKVSFPAEFHAQTSVECAIALHPEVKDRLDDIEKIVIHTHESAIRIIDKRGVLKNPSDRDHCLQYCTAIGLIYGDLHSGHYEDMVALTDKRIDELREKMHIVENPDFSFDYHNPEKRSIANSITIHYKDGTKSDTVQIEYPIGHPKRRSDALPLLEKKFFGAIHDSNLFTSSNSKLDQIKSLYNDMEKLNSTSITEFINLFSL
ncbi:hypothetical protein CYY_002281 [Polysphondylium violaceum]|uniref:2-methylcitrate dehydratase n=1 Tax=Polysphondylium violaceum TaxID=133409 RepID=A0A8J4V9S4_9MYCE|nr:hypothetical protein CYY_002281 [Polysphondylium violaceum]